MTLQILLTNDDGPLGPGFCELSAALGRFGRVTVLCPASERSGIGHAITYMTPVQFSEVRLADGSPAHTLTGTPADCVKFAVRVLLESPPDLVVSGPNFGINVGADVFYSGTAAAALEGGLNGIPSAAFSTSRGNRERMDAVAEQAVRVLNLLMARGTSGAPVYNVNIPALDDAREPEVCFTRQWDGLAPERYVRQDGPRGRVHYWLDADGEAEPPAGTDAAAVAGGCISVTPLRANLTEADLLGVLRRRPPGPGTGREDHRRCSDERQRWS